MEAVLSAVPPGSVRRQLLAELSVHPDPFQTRALDALDEGRSVLVMAPTGAGKTLVADYAIARVRAGDADEAPGSLAVYTTPLKALSNQKYRDLALRLGTARVGLITGDRVVNPDAPVLVMTTEVLRAMLYNVPPEATTDASGRRDDGRRFDRQQFDVQPLDRQGFDRQRFDQQQLAGRRFDRHRLGAVVLDEFHYLQDPERGSAWEEVVIRVPQKAQLVCLSATMPDAGVVRDWLEAVHGPTTLVVAEQRPVELNHLYAIGNLRRNPPLLLPMQIDGRINQAAELFDGARRETRGEGRRVRDRDRPVPPAREDLLKQLAGADLLPGIWFVFSRSGCDQAVADLVDSGVRLTTEAEAYQIRDLVASALEPLDSGEWRAITAEAWQRRLEAGIAAHHGGLAPIQRDVVEEAFARGLVKVAFATETLALGVNLPARTVVIDRTVRAGGEVLTAAEFAQLGGRAGRRGIDSVGHVVVPWSPQVSFQRIASLIGGQLAALRSEFTVTPAMAANLVRVTPDLAAARGVVESSLRHWLNLRRVAVLRSDLTVRKAELTALAATSEPAGAGVPEADAGRSAEGLRAAVEEALAAVVPGDVLVDPSRLAAGPVVVLATSRKRGQVCVDVVRPDARRVQLTPRSLRARPVVVGRLALDSWVRTERGHARRAADALAAFEVPPGLAESSGSARAKPRSRRADPGAAYDRQLRQVGDLERLVAETEGAVSGELEAVVRLLRRRGHVNGWSLTPSGQVLARLFHPSGLLLAESMAAGLLDGLDPPTLASMASWFTARTRMGGLRPTGFATSALTGIYERVREINRSVVDDEVAEGLPPTQYPEPALGVPVYRWALGADLDVALADSGVLVGDLIREVRQVAELLEQVMAVSGAHQPTAQAAVDVLRRGAVIAE